MLFKIISSLLVVTTLHAQEIRLDKNDGPFAKMPMTNQGNLGICYSHAMTQAASAELIKKGKLAVNQISSPYLASLEAKNLHLLNLLHWNRTIEGGYSCRTFKKSIKRYGTCPTDDVENKFYQSREYFGRSSFNSIVANVHADLRKVYRLNSQDQKAAVVQTADILNNIYGDDVALDNAGIKNALSANTANVFSARLLGKQCQERVSMKNYKCKKDILFFHSDLGIQRSKDKVENFLKKKITVMVGYCSKVISEGPGYRGLMKSDCGMHASVIIGQRDDSKGNRQFLVRNSWGANCNGLNPKWQCDSPGQFWIDAKELLLNSQSLEVIVP